MKNISQFQVEVAAEAYVAGILAQAGCDVSVRYGANQPEYDLIATKKNKMKKISVKGSQDGGWMLSVSEKKQTKDYHKAADAWLKNHTDKGVIYAFVQFKNCEIGKPNIYFCTIKEAADYLKKSRDGHGDVILREDHTWSGRGKARPGTRDKIPEHWKATQKRIDEIMRL